MSTPAAAWLAKSLVFLLDPATKENVVTTSNIGSGLPDYSGSSATTLTTRSFGDAVEFSGANQKELWINGSTDLTDTTFGGDSATGKTITLVAVAELKAGATGERRVLGFELGASNTSLFNLGSNGTNWYFQVRSNSNVNKTATGPAVSAGATVRLVGRLNATAGTVDLWVNGTKYSATGYSGSVNTRGVVVGALSRGGGTATPEQVFSGYIGACAVFNDDLSDSDCAALSQDETSLFEAEGGDTTAPTLSSPTGTATGSTTASGSVSTDEANGTLYRLASTNATELAATVKAAALTTAVSATGVQTGVTFSGLTASTTYYAHYLHSDAAGNDSAVVSSASFTTDAAGGTSINPGAGTITITGYAPSVSQTSGGTITTEPLKNNTGTLLANETGATVHVYETTGALVVTKTGQTTNASGIMTISDALIQPATEYRIVIVLGSGAEGMDRITAA